ncbi:geranylgeranylglycerol-phosphate geranylgeranyltransferase [bacterium]|nr:geranylgeranylglycerol-phosphate geranylgeranyltransferase [bacterium]
MIKPYLQILRPLNVLIAFVSVIVAVAIAADDQMIPWEAAIEAALSAALICGAANAINDYYDLDIDRINKPSRPLVAGSITPANVRILWIVVSAAGIWIAGLINWQCLCIAIVSFVMLFFYSTHLKRTPIWGNFVVSLLTALAFIYGGVAIGKIEEIFFPAIFSFLFHFGREIIKDMEDMEGDALLGARTLPIAYGVQAAQIVTTITFIALIGFTLWAFLLQKYSGLYFSIVLIGIYPVIFFTIFSVWKNFSPKNLNRLSNLLKLDMLIGLVAIYLG